MKYGIVQEVMKVEERKAIRAEVAARPPPSPKPVKKKEATKTPEKQSPGKNLDLMGLPSSEKKQPQTRSSNFAKTKNDSILTSELSKMIQ